MKPKLHLRSSDSGPSSLQQKRDARASWHQPAVEKGTWLHDITLSKDQSHHSKLPKNLRKIETCATTGCVRGCVPPPRRRLRLWRRGEKQPIHEPQKGEEYDEPELRNLNKSFSIYRSCTWSGPSGGTGTGSSPCGSSRNISGSSLGSTLPGWDFTLRYRLTRHL